MTRSPAFPHINNTHLSVSLYSPSISLIPCMNVCIYLYIHFCSHLYMSLVTRVTLYDNNFFSKFILYKFAEFNFTIYHWKSPFSFLEICSFCFFITVFLTYKKDCMVIIFLAYNLQTKANFCERENNVYDHQTTYLSTSQK